MNKRVLIGLVFVAAFEGHAFHTRTAVLHIGDPVPPLAASKWFVGEPVTKFETGMVHVVAFWSTWSQPSRDLAPRLNDMEKKYQGKAKVLAVSVFEKQLDENERYKAIAQSIRETGLKCHVTADTSAGVMGRSWLWAADETTPPVVFVVERDGKIGWIGLPDKTFETIVEQAVAGTLDRKAMQQARASQRGLREKEDEALKQMNDLWREKKYEQALASLDKFISEKPGYRQGLVQFRYNLLLDADEAAAYRYAKELSQGDYKSDANNLAGMALSICQTPNLKNPDYALALALARQACELSDPNKARHLLTLAEVYLKTNDHDHALKAIEQAKDSARSQSDSPEKSALLEEIESRFLRVREAKTKTQPTNTSVQ
jgi:tetratricopeptide (TPR) repeat protein